jgi:hypothetical protein
LKNIFRWFFLRRFFCEKENDELISWMRLFSWLTGFGSVISDGRLLLQCGRVDFEAFSRENLNSEQIRLIFRGNSRKKGSVFQSEARDHV